jgi:hypothetical protein
MQLLTILLTNGINYFITQQRVKLEDMVIMLTCKKIASLDPAFPDAATLQSETENGEYNLYIRRC